MTTFVDMYHPALGNVHISVPDIPAALSLYEAHGWVLSGGGGPDPTPIDLTVGLGDLRYAKLGDIATPGTPTGDALRAAFGRAAPVLSNFSYDATTGNLLSYQEDGITITLTYNADGTVATSKRGADATQTYTYSGGNLVGIA